MNLFDYGLKLDDEKPLEYEWLFEDWSVYDQEDWLVSYSSTIPLLKDYHVVVRIYS